mgnify:CR=1 FL=1
MRLILMDEADFERASDIIEMYDEMLATRDTNKKMILQAVITAKAYAMASIIERQWEQLDGK